MKIDETHDLVIEPGPYPPGEGPLDYAECVHDCADWRKPCAITWPTEGWEYNEEPAPSRTAEVDDDKCTYCGTSVGYTEAEYEGQYGLRLVQVWIDSWSHPDANEITLCEECVCFVESWATR